MCDLPTVPARSFREAWLRRKDSFMGEFKDKAKGLGNEIAGNVKQAAGKASDNQRLEGGGIAQENKGEGQNLKGKLKGSVGDKV